MARAADRFPPVATFTVEEEPAAGRKCRGSISPRAASSIRSLPHDDAEHRLTPGLAGLRPVARLHPHLPVAHRARAAHAVFVKNGELSLEQFWSTVTASACSPRIGRALGLAARRRDQRRPGLMLAWALVRYTFPGKRLIDALVDLPFALPTAVAGISLTALAKNGWLGQYLEPLGIKVAFTPLGVLVALIFIGLPFVVRTVQPVLEDMDADFEEAAATLGASRWQAFTRVVLPTLTPALLTGFALAFARAVGEYGSVIFIAGNIPMVSEITPLTSSPSSSSTTTGERHRRRHAPGLLHPAAAHQRSAGLDQPPRGETI